jgi:CarD family transcriptional regulator
MNEQDMSFQVGDQVIHWVHGLGEIIQLDEKVLSGNTGQYYVVQIRDLKLWVPISESGERGLRTLTPADDFQKLFEILASPGESLTTNVLERKTQLSDRLKDGSLESICRVVRDLVYYKQTNKFNENDKSILERASNSLLNEWSIVLSVSVHQADHQLQELLGAGVLATKS